MLASELSRASAAFPAFHVLDLQAIREIAGAGRKPPQLAVQPFIGHLFPDRPAPGLNVSDQTGKPIDALPDLGRNVGELRYLAALRYVPPFPESAHTGSKP